MTRYASSSFLEAPLYTGDIEGERARVTESVWYGAGEEKYNTLVCTGGVQHTIIKINKTIANSFKVLKRESKSKKKTIRFNCNKLNLFIYNFLNSIYSIIRLCHKIGHN